MLLYPQVWAGEPAEVKAKKHRKTDRAKRDNDHKNKRRKTGNNYIAGELLVLVSVDSQNDTQSRTESKFQEVDALIPGTIKRRIKLNHRKHSKKRPKKRILRVQLPKGKTVKQALAENWSKKDSRIKLVEPNYYVKTQAIPNDSFFPQLWALNNTGQTGGVAGFDIHATQAWELTTGSSEVIVAVIDSGIDYNHPDLAENIWVNSGEIPDNGIDDDQNGFIDDIYGYDFADNDSDPMDENNHGTHVAGTIAAHSNNALGVTGVNWQCRVMACKFLGADGYGNVSDAIEAINYAIANGATILNNSWGWQGNPSVSLETAIINARDNGVLFVAAAGNDSIDTDNGGSYPACYEISNVISVAATDRYGDLAQFSNYGRNSVHLGAPGANIISTIRNSGYASFNGTSMAAPHVSGVAALLMAYYPEITLQDLKSRIVITGTPNQSLLQTTISGRHLNAYNALNASNGITVIAPENAENWQQGHTYTISWCAIDAEQTVNIYLLKGQDIHSTLAEDIQNNGYFDWQIPADLTADSDYAILIDDGTNEDQSDNFFTIVQARDYNTEYFSGLTDAFDLSNKSVLLKPDGNGGYQASIEPITSLPTDPAEGEQLLLGDDDYQRITLDGQSLLLFEQSVDSFYVGSNGYITFTQGDTDYSESLTDHFDTLRISGLFEDLNPSQAGSVSYLQTTESVAVTWLDVPEYGSYNKNTFQIEMFFNGRIRLNWLGIQAPKGIVGLSQGTGQSLDYMETDFSVCPDRNTPVAHYKLNDPNDTTAVDSSGYDNHATLINAPVWTDDGSLDFDGVDDALEIPTADLNASNGTLALWVYPKDLTGTAFLFGHSNNGNRIHLYTVGNLLCLGMGDSSALNIESFTFQQWYHIALTWNGSDYAVYVNGREKAAGAYSGLTNVNILADIGNNGQIANRNKAFNGLVDDVRMYNRALAGYEILNLFYLIEDTLNNENRTMQFTLNTVNSENDILNYTCRNLPPGATFNNNIFTWRPWYDTAGSHEISFVETNAPDQTYSVIIEVKNVELTGWYKEWIEHFGLL
jgi:subtilisin family serine protease